MFLKSPVQNGSQMAKCRRSPWPLMLSRWRHDSNGGICQEVTGWKKCFCNANDSMISLIWYLFEWCLIRSDTLSDIFNDDKDTCLNDPQESKMKKSESWEPGKAFFVQDSWFYLKVEDQFTLHAVFDGHGQKGGGPGQVWHLSSQLLLVPGHDVSLYVKDNLPKIMLVAWFSAAPLETSNRGQKNRLTLELDANQLGQVWIIDPCGLISVASNLIMNVHSYNIRIYVYIDTYIDYIDIHFIASDIWYGWRGHNNI